jgi:hypothetical protein
MYLRSRLPDVRTEKLDLSVSLSRFGRVTTSATDLLTSNMHVDTTNVIYSILSQLHSDEHGRSQRHALHDTQTQIRNCDVQQHARHRVLCGTDGR